MKAYEVFKSEGGYRVCGGVYLGGPIIDQSPWFATKEEAESAAIRMKEKAARRDEETREAFGLPSDAELEKMEAEGRLCP